MTFALRSPIVLVLTLVLTGGVRAQDDTQKRIALVAIERERDVELSDQLVGLAYDAMRRADGYEPLDLIRTRAELEDAGAMGLLCDVQDMKCLTKLAILLRVDQLVVVDAQQGLEGDVTLALVLVDASATSKLNQVHGVLPPVGPARVTAVRELVHALIAPFQPTKSGAQAKVERGPDAEAGEPTSKPVAPSSSVATPVWVAGGVLASGGALLALSTGLAAGAIDGALLLTDVGDSRKAREDLLTGERVLAAASVAGVFFAVAGVAVMGAGWVLE